MLGFNRIFYNKITTERGLEEVPTDGRVGLPMCGQGMVSRGSLLLCTVLWHHCAFSVFLFLSFFRRSTKNVEPRVCTKDPYAGIWDLCVSFPFLSPMESRSIKLLAGGRVFGSGLLIFFPVPFFLYCIMADMPILFWNVTGLSSPVKGALANTVSNGRCCSKILHLSSSRC